MKEKRVNVAKFLLVSMVIVLFLTMLFSIRANAREKGFSKATDEAETIYRSDIRKVLKAEGAANAGINLTKITEDGRNFEYSVVINLPSYINLDDMEKENLLNELYAIKLDVENADVTFSFS